MDEWQLAWVQRNRGGRRGPELVGGLAARVLESRSVAGPPWRQELGALVYEHGGEEFSKAVCGLRFARGVLTLEVAEPAVLYHLRLRWEQRLLTVLQAELPEAGIGAVRFVASRSV